MNGGGDYDDDDVVGHVARALPVAEQIELIGLCKKFECNNFPHISVRTAPVDSAVTLPESRPSLLCRQKPGHGMHRMRSRREGA